MLNTDVLWAKNYPDDVESKGVTGPLKARHPDFGRPAELPLLPPAYRRDRSTKSVGRASLDFYKGDGSLAIVSTLARRHQVDVTVPVLESTIGDLPAMHGEPLLRDSFAF